MGRNKKSARVTPLCIFWIIWKEKNRRSFENGGAFWLKTEKHFFLSFVILDKVIYKWMSNVLNWLCWLVGFSLKEGGSSFYLFIYFYFLIFLLSLFLFARTFCWPILYILCILVYLFWLSFYIILSLFTYQKRKKGRLPCLEFLLPITSHASLSLTHPPLSLALSFAALSLALFLCMPPNHFLSLFC